MSSYGFRVRDESGRITLDTTDRMGRIIGSVITPSLAPNQSLNGSFQVGNLDYYGKPILYVTSNFDLNGNSKFRIWYSSGVIFYELSTVSAAYIPQQTVWYGVM